MDPQTHPGTPDTCLDARGAAGTKEQSVRVQSLPRLDERLRSVAGRMTWR